MPEAIEEILLDVCFGVLFLAADEAALLFAAEGFALVFAAAGRAGAAAFFGAAAFAPPLFPPRDAAPPPAFLATMF